MFLRINGEYGPRFIELLQRKKKYGAATHLKHVFLPSNVKFWSPESTEK